MWLMLLLRPTVRPADTNALRTRPGSVKKKFSPAVAPHAPHEYTFDVRTGLADALVAVWPHPGANSSD